MKRKYLILTTLAGALFAGCSPRISEVVTERVELRHDTIRLESQRRDSILVRDSIVMSIRGDTLTREVWRWRERVRTRCDTVLKIVEHNQIEQNDTVQAKADHAGLTPARILRIVIILIIIAAAIATAIKIL